MHGQLDLVILVELDKKKNTVQTKLELASN